MRVYLVQHGEAKGEEEDPERPLTDRGAEDVRRVAELARDLWSVAPERVVHSGKTRARQTAEIWGTTAGIAVTEMDGLAPLDDPSVWTARLTDEERDLMLVGHLPHLAGLANELLRHVSGPPAVTFRPGGLVGLERGPEAWTVWLLLPPGAP
jgi:phosphohistidine phosphatase